MFQSQNELHAVHSRHAYSHTHLHTAHGGGEDDDSWVYHPQHRIGEEEGVEVGMRGAMAPVKIELTPSMMHISTCT